MTTINPVVRTPRVYGFYPMYIRIIHNRKPGYIKTDKIMDAVHISKSGDITAPVVNEYCSRIVLEYSDRLNCTDVSTLELKEVIEHLTSVDEEVCFSTYAQFHISRMEKYGQCKNAKNYKLAVQHL